MGVDRRRGRASGNRPDVLQMRRIGTVVGVAHGAQAVGRRTVPWRLGVAGRMCAAQANEASEVSNARQGVPEENNQKSATPDIGTDRFNT